MSRKQTYFQTDWLEKEEYKNRLKPCMNKKIAFCGKCRKTVELSNMGEQALKSHMNEKMHIADSKSVTCFFQPKSVTMIQPVVTDIGEGPSGSSEQLLTVSTSQNQSILLTQKSTDAVEKRKAEIVWVLNCVVCDWSANSAEHIFNIFHMLQELWAIFPLLRQSISFSDILFFHLLLLNGIT